MKKIYNVETGKYYTNPLKAFQDLEGSKHPYKSCKKIGECKVVVSKERAFQKSNLKQLLDLKKTGGELTHSPFKSLGDL